MCPFIAFVSRTECQASRLRLCRHADDLFFAEEGNSSCRNVQHNILASVNFLNIFLSKFSTSLSTHQTFLMSFNLQCNNAERQVEEKCCPNYRTLMRFPAWCEQSLKVNLTSRFQNNIDSNLLRIHQIRERQHPQGQTQKRTF